MYALLEQLSNITVVLFHKIICISHFTNKLICNFYLHCFPEKPKERPRHIDTTPNTDEAQKKFGNAKAISSDQYFGNQDNDHETKANLSRFHGSTSISSAEFFGNGKGK